MRTGALFSSFTLIFLFSFFMNSTISAESEPPNYDNDSSHIEDKDGGKVVFRLKKDFLSLANFLHLTEKEYFQLRENKSMVEIAEMQGINEGDLFNYLVLTHYEALELAYNKEEINLYFVMDYVLRLKGDIEWEMEVKSITLDED